MNFFTTVTCCCCNCDIIVVISCLVRFSTRDVLRRNYGERNLNLVVRVKKTGLGGFEPPTSGLEARRYVQAKPQAPTPITYDFGIINMCYGIVPPKVLHLLRAATQKNSIIFGGGSG